MYLRDLLAYDDFVVQCHDLPDADSIAAAYALYAYFKSNGKKVTLVYSGSMEISRVNVKLMIEKLEIPLNHVAPDFECPEMLITVGCQYGADNVTRLRAREIAIIDNHYGFPPSSVKYSHIKNSFGSCSALVYQMLLSEIVTNRQDQVLSVTKDMSVATALYYGVYMATNEFSDIIHSADADVRDELEYDKELFTGLQYSTLSIDELKIVGEALANYHYDQNSRFAVVYVKACDPSVLGFVSDIICRVNSIDCCVVYADLGYFYKLSIRTSSREIKPGELIDFITVKIGEGGGKDKKAGGIIYKEKYENNYPGLNIEKYFMDKFSEFKNSCDCIDAKNYDFDLHKEQFSKYTKMSFVLGYVKTTDLIENSAELILRTYEGNVKVVASPNVYIMVGINGEVYPIARETFDVSYKECEAPFDFAYDYEPRVYNGVTGQMRLLKSFIRPCRTLARLSIWAKEITKPTKLFPKNWDYENYMFGLEGDYLVARMDDRKDLYIVKRNIFARTYKKAQEKVLPQFNK
ncbi:MAG: DHH family phosphoesterase [Succinivibrionaceae bacterium]|nr:DHH family phosphoesterase [Succinivibrionaceae bacterium]